MKNKYTHVIIGDKEGKPMAWSGDQLCYCTNTDWQDDHHMIRPYTVRHAKRLIAKSEKYRSENNFSETGYILMPIKL